MNTTADIMSLADDYADWAVDKSKAHPSTVEVREALHTAIDALVEQAKWAHHTPALLTNADAAADLAGVARPGSEPVLFVYPAHLAGDLSQVQTWKPGYQVADEIPLYTAPPQASQPLTAQEVEAIIARHDYQIHGDRARYIVRMTEQAHGIGAAQKASQPAQDAADADMPLDKDGLAQLIAPMLYGTYHCTRVWEAWNVGTMSPDDFEPVDESDTPHEIADAILAAIAAQKGKP